MFRRGTIQSRTSCLRRSPKRFCILRLSTIVLPAANHRLGKAVSDGSRTRRVMMDRRVSRMSLALILLGIFVAPISGWAENYPNRPVRLVVPFPAGGPADALGRVLADQLNKMWGEPVVVENRG